MTGVSVERAGSGRAATAHFIVGTACVRVCDIAHEAHITDASMHQPSTSTGRALNPAVSRYP